MLVYYVAYMEDYELLSPELKERYDNGEIVILRREVWENPDKPVVRTVGTMYPVKGTGRVKGAKLAAEASKESAWKRRGGYRRALETLVAEFKDSPDRDKAVTSMEEILEAVARTITQRGDAKEGLHLIEILAGKAKETQEVNVNARHLHSLLNEVTPVTELAIRAVDVTDIEARRKQIEEAQ